MESSKVIYNCPLRRTGQLCCENLDQHNFTTSSSINVVTISFTCYQRQEMDHLVNMTKSTGNWGFGHIYRRNPQWKTSFSVQCNIHRDA